MTKNVQTKTTPCDINYVDIDEAIKTLENLIDRFGNNGYISVTCDDICSYHYKVEETDAEYETRIYKAKIAAQQEVEIRRKQYEKLKKEFE
jgi:hypothetical protein